MAPVIHRDDEVADVVAAAERQDGTASVAVVIEAVVDSHVATVVDVETEADSVRQLMRKTHSDLEVPAVYEGARVVHVAAPNP